MLGVHKLPQVSERRIYPIRWLLTVGWLGIIMSLFFDPISAISISPSRSFPWLRFNPSQFDPSQCVLVQGTCLAQQPGSIALTFFWSIVVPGSIFILLVFGHDTWRRMCPLSFLSQIPRALGIQRKRQSTKSGSGGVRYELVKIKKDSWLGKNHLYVQFGLLAIGLAARLLLMNADGIALAIVSLLTIGAAMTVGYLYEGKSWCQYFCPMAPVQMVFTGPRGLLGSEAHQGPKQTVTQSMCRTVDKDGREKSACVGCQSPCIDIDAERNYWETANKPGRRFVHYGYVGLLLGFFFYTFLYAGNFDYLFSGAWMREANPIAALGQPGFYIAGQAIAIPKLIAVPLTLGFSVAFSYAVLTRLEKAYRANLSAEKVKEKLNSQQASHTLFSICTFLCFNLFFFFGSQSLMAAFPFSVHLLFNGFIVLVSTLWLSRTLDRSAELYSRESLAASLRRQLAKLTIDFSRFLEGRSMDDLKAEEVYVLAKVLPGFNQEQGLQVYKGVLREALEQGTTDSASSLEALRQLRQELNLKDDDHFTVLTELGSAEPDLLDPRKRRTRESQLRIESYRQALASMLLDLVDSGMSLQEAMQRQRKQIQFLKLEYGMTSEEENSVLNQILAGEQTTILRKAESLLEQMQQLAFRYQLLSDPVLDGQTIVFQLLRQSAVQHKQQIIAKQMLGLLEVLGDTPDAIKLANSTRELTANVLPDILQTSEGMLSWKYRLKPGIFAVLDRSFNPVHAAGSPNSTAKSTLDLTTTNIYPEVLPPPTVSMQGKIQGKKSSQLQDSQINPKNNGATARPEALAQSTNGASAAKARSQEDSSTLLPILSLPPENRSPAASTSASVRSQAGLAEEINRSDRRPFNGSSIPSFQSRSPDIESFDSQSLVDLLEEFLHDLDPLTQTLALYALNLLVPPRAQQKAQEILAIELSNDSAAMLSDEPSDYPSEHSSNNSPDYSPDYLSAHSLSYSANYSSHWLIQETAQILIDRDRLQTPEVQTLIIRSTLASRVEKHLFQQPVIRVGSSKANDLILDQPQISPYHAVFYLDGEGFSILDLGSDSGLLIDHQPLHHDRSPLQQGQTIQFGDGTEPVLTVNWEKQPLRQTISPSVPEVIGTIDKVLLLFESRFFRSLKPDALVELARDATIQIYACGEQICQAGDPSDSILLLIDGTAEVVILQGTNQQNTNQQTIGTVNRGETIGEMGVLTRQPRSASVIAGSDYCRVMVIQAEKFDTVLRQDAEISRNLLVVLSLRLQDMNRKLRSAQTIVANE
ncbi:cyclic nucleotide-binding domain-containing protein [Leptolyngbya ohadii]|uniref:cyclic nucleotide-binding domain-containing protein n=1 Tax=Leptolyngbya ohadii TaxID=1962290 RepID=UPI000B59B46D|nr:cyclic nucleotide-binding domain-containing protein [Leptolyngbya ohadii]